MSRSQMKTSIRGGKKHLYSRIRDLACLLQNILYYLIFLFIDYKIKYFMTLLIFLFIAYKKLDIKKGKNEDCAIVK